MIRRLATIDEVIGALGGNRAVRRRLRATPQQVTNWRARKRFPRTKYLAMTEALEEAGCTAPPRLWGMGR